MQATEEEETTASGIVLTFNQPFNPAALSAYANVIDPN